MASSTALPATIRNVHQVYRAVAGPLVLLVMLVSVLVTESIMTATDGTLVLTVSLVGSGLIGYAAPVR